MTIAPLATALPTPVQRGSSLPGVPALFELPMPVDTAVKGLSGSNTAADEDADASTDDAEGSVMMLPLDGPIAVAEVRPSAQTLPVQVPATPSAIADAPAMRPVAQSVGTIGPLPGSAVASGSNAPITTLPIDPQSAVAEPTLPESAETAPSRTSDRFPEGATNDRGMLASSGSPTARPPTLPTQVDTELASSAHARAPLVPLVISSAVSTLPEPSAPPVAPSGPVGQAGPAILASVSGKPSASEPAPPDVAIPTQQSATETAPSATKGDASTQATKSTEDPLQPGPARFTADNIVRSPAELPEQIKAQSIGAQSAPAIALEPLRAVTIPQKLPVAFDPTMIDRGPVEHALQRASKPSTELLTDQLLPAPVPNDGNAVLAAPAERPDGATLPIASGMTASVPATALSTPVTTLTVLDIDSGGQWIDRLALEISSAAKDGGARLKLTPDNLGELTIAIRTGDSGACVVITTQDEAVRSMLAGAQERLASEARAYGLRLADVQTQLSGDSGAPAQQQSRQMPQPALWDGDKQPKRMMWMQSDNHEEALSTGRWA